MKSSRVLAVCLAILFIGWRPADGSPVPAVDLTSIVENSEVIVVGRAVHVRIGPVDRVNQVAPESFVIRIDKLLKGWLPDPEKIEVETTISQAYSGVSDEDYGIYFLLSNSNGSYGLVDPYNPVLVANPERRSKCDDGSSDLENVVAELANVLEHPEELSKNDEEHIDRAESRDGERDGKGSSHEERVQQLLAEAAAALQSVPLDVSGKYLKRLAHSDSLLTRLWANICILSGGDTTYFKSIASDLIHPRHNLELTISSAASVIKGTVALPDFVTTLERLLDSENSEIRQAAAFDMSLIGTTAVEKPLATKVLVDSDQDMEYYAVSGLERAVNGPDQVPSLGLFVSQKEAYLQLWETWSREHFGN